MSESLVAALARAQAKMEHPKKSKTNPHFKSTYADLADVLNAVKPALNAEGIAIVQVVEDGCLLTSLMLGEEAISSRIPLAFDVKPQELGSQLSYLRRYALSAIAGVASEDDDDGNAASSAKPSSKRTTAAPVASDDAPTAGQLAEFKRLCDALGIDDAKDKGGFVSATLGREAKWSSLSQAEADVVTAALVSIASGEQQLVYGNDGRPMARPLGEPFEVEGEAVASSTRESAPEAASHPEPLSGLVAARAAVGSRKTEP